MNINEIGFRDMAGIKLHPKLRDRVTYSLVCGHKIVLLLSQREQELFKRRIKGRIMIKCYQCEDEELEQ